MGDTAIPIGSRMRTQAPPPAVVFEALVQPDRDPYRPWLKLLDDEQAPRILRTAAPTTVVWSSIWLRRPDAVITFDLQPSPDGGTELRWTLTVREPVPDDSLIGHWRHRLNRLINADLRYTFGQ